MWSRIHRFLEICRLYLECKCEIRVSDKRFGVRCYYLFGSFSLEWHEIEEIYCYQAEPFDITFRIVDTNGKSRYVSEDMKGWDELFAAILARFPDIDEQEIEGRKLTLNEEVLCWQRRDAPITEGPHPSR